MLPTALIALTGLLSTVSALATRQTFPPLNHDTPDFRLRTRAIDGNCTFSDLYISGFHTGAGLNAAVGLRNETRGANFFLNSTYLNMEGANGIPYSIGLLPSAPYNSTAPPTYLYVDINFGANTPGFHLRHDTVVYQGHQEPFASFAVCYVEGVSPYVSVGPQFQLLWRPRDVEANEACADVVLQAVF